MLEVTARSAADLAGIQANTVALFYHKIRQVIAAHLELQAEEMLGGEIELDESYFGGVRKGKRGRGAAGKVAVFGLLKRDGRIYTKIIDDTKTDTLMPIIRSKIGYIPIAIVAIMRSMLASFIISVSTIPHTSQRAEPTMSTVSRILELGKTGAQKI